MDPPGEPTPAPLVVFGPNQIDTSRAEMLVQCLNNKIKEKRYKLQKLIANNEEKKTRNETMKNEKLQLTSKLAQLEQENSVREQQLQSEQIRIKELQLNIQMLDEHNNSIKHDCINDERKYEQEKSTLIQKFEQTKQQWTNVFKPQYEQSRVYQYLKQSDLAYTALVERKEILLNSQKLAYRDYWTRRQQCWKEKNLHLTIVQMAKCFLVRRHKLDKIQQIQSKIIELENQKKRLAEIKIDKMKAWESVYIQPVKRDLMDFCLQANIDQALTVSFSQIQQDFSSQPSTPTVSTKFTLFNDQTESMAVIQYDNSTTLPCKPLIECIDNQQNARNLMSPPPGTTESSITIVPMISTIISDQIFIPNRPNQLNRPIAPSVLHLTTAIDDDDDEVFSSHRKLPTVQMEKMTINDSISSTQGFVTSSNCKSTMMPDVSLKSKDQSLNISTPSISIESNSMEDFRKPILNTKTTELSTNSSNETNSNKSHLNVTFQLAPPRLANRTGASITSSIQPQVTSTDVQQMLLTFSTEALATTEEQPQPMEDDTIDQSPQQQQQVRPEYPIISSIESAASIEEEYSNFNYNFGFQGSTQTDGDGEGRGFTSPINFGSWPNLGSPMGNSTNDQFSTFLQQSAENISDESSSFTFASFNYADLNTTDTTFGSFFFGNSTNSTHSESKSDGK